MAFVSQSTASSHRRTIFKAAIDRKAMAIVQSRSISTSELHICWV